MTKQMKSKIIDAVDAAGYYFDELESTDDNLRFLGEGGQVLYMDSWKEAKEWLDGVVFDDPAVSDRVEKILHPERFRDKKQSVLMRLNDKKKEIAAGTGRKEALQRKSMATIKRSRNVEKSM